MSIADNIEFLSRLPQISDFVGGQPVSPLREVEDFGANPGDLSMWCYAPPNLPPNSPVVVVLHGCTQTAVAFDYGSGWSALADRYGFALLFPEQRRSNNPNLCFNWFDPEKTARGGGEVLSIHRMIAAMVRLHHVSEKRIYITGLSAGGAMASAMLAAYPEVFAGGAIIAGLPFGVASNLREALSAMATAPGRPAHELGDLVRHASSHSGRWPKISVWHGTADRTVNHDNSDQIVAQWLDLHAVPLSSMEESVVDGQSKSVWRKANGEVAVESYTISEMGHGVPLSLETRDDSYGIAGPFMLESGISSTFHIAQFFDLIDEPQDNAPSPAPLPKAAPRAKPVPLAAEVGPMRPRTDVLAIIKRALTSAGLIK